MHEPYIYFLPKYMLKNKLYECEKKIKEYAELHDKLKFDITNCQYLQTDKARQNLRHYKVMLIYYKKKSHDYRINLITKGL